jgi:predicted RNA binding protein YcfA (HicA-like mRNA interferase family)
MPQFEKFKAKVMKKQPPRDISPEQMQSFLNKCGFVRVNAEGSHWTYKHPLLRGRNDSHE